MKFTEKSNTGTYVVTGSPRSGKTALLSHYADTMAKDSNKVLYFSMDEKPNDYDCIIGVQVSGYNEVLTATKIALKHCKYTVFVDDFSRLLGDSYTKQSERIEELHKICYNNNVELVVAITDDAYSRANKSDHTSSMSSNGNIFYIADQVERIVDIRFDDKVTINTIRIKDRYSSVNKNKIYDHTIENYAFKKLFYKG